MSIWNKLFGGGSKPPTTATPKPQQSVGGVSSKKEEAQRRVGKLAAEFAIAVKNSDRQKIVRLTNNESLDCPKCGHHFRVTDGVEMHHGGRLLFSCNCPSCNTEAFSIGVG